MKIKKIAESFFTLANVIHSLTSTSESDALAAICGKELNEKIEKSKGIVLFESESENGTTENFNTIDDSKNYEWVAITYKTDTLDTKIVRINYKNNVKVTIGNNGNGTWFKHKIVQFSDKLVTTVDGYKYDFDPTNNNFANVQKTNDICPILSVVGFNKKETATSL